MIIRVTMSSGQVLLVCDVNGTGSATPSSMSFRDGSGDYV